METKNNQNAIWFHQTDGTRHRIIDYYENVGEGIQRYATKVHEIGRRRGFTFGKHYGPHDIGHRSWANDARTRKDIASDLGIEFEVVPVCSRSRLWPANVQGPCQRWLRSALSHH